MQLGHGSATSFVTSIDDVLLSGMRIPQQKPFWTEEFCKRRPEPFTSLPKQDRPEWTPVQKTTIQRTQLKNLRSIDADCSLSWHPSSSI